jgi:acetyl esterase/lipase
MNEVKALFPPAVDTEYQEPVRTITLKPSWQARLLNAFYRRAVKGRSKRLPDLADMRRLMARLDRWLVSGEGARRIPVDAEGVSAEWITGRAATTARTLLYLHGGGFMLRSPRIHARLAARLCDVLDARALMPHYRLAPEHPLPAAHEDCFHAYRWLCGEGHRPENIVLAGDSAGGLLVLATLQRIRDAGLPAPACAALFSPGSDLAALHSAVAAADDDPMISAEALELLQRLVVAPVDAHDPAISPCAGSLAGLPPLLIQVGSTEALLGQSIRAATLARAGGTHVELQIWPQMPHVFQAVTWLPESGRALAMVGAFADRLTRPPRVGSA